MITKQVYLSEEDFRACAILAESKGIKIGTMLKILIHERLSEYREEVEKLADTYRNPD